MKSNKDPCVYYITVDHDVPIPQRFTGPTAILRSMNKGDSIILPKHAVEPWRASAYKIGIMLATRKTTKTECRVWRVN